MMKTYMGQRREVDILSVAKTYLVARGIAPRDNLDFRARGKASV